MSECVYFVHKSGQWERSVIGQYPTLRQAAMAALRLCMKEQEPGSDYEIRHVRIRDGRLRHKLAYMVQCYPVQWDVGMAYGRPAAFEIHSSRKLHWRKLYTYGPREHSED